MYFCLSFESDFKTTLIYVTIISIFAGLGFLIFRGKELLFSSKICVGVILISLGFLHIKYRSDQLNTPQLRGQLSYAPFQGRVTHIERLVKGTRLTISDVTFQKTYRSSLPLPHTIRVTYRGSLQPEPTLIPGDLIGSVASLSPPSPPVIPHGYDFRRKAYFEGIGGVGYGLKPVKIIPLNQHEQIHDAQTVQTESIDFTQMTSRLHTALTHYRYQLTNYIQNQIPGQSGAIMAALVTGDRSGITKETRDVFANSGLAHILAISGLHLSLVAGFIFLCIRRGLTCFSHIALTYNTKKLAAGFALLFTLAYLFISGLTIPAQRAFFMTALVLMAIMTDRIALTLRNVSLAALIILLLKPETLLGPSFQLSFAAVVALVAFYEAYNKPLRQLLTRISESRFSFIKRLLFYICTLIITSLIATLATLPLTIFTFNRFSIVAVITNLLAIPLVSFCIMPLIVLSLIGGPYLFSCLSPFIDYAINGLQDIAHFGNALPGSVIHIASIPLSFKMITIVALLWLALMQSRWRYYGFIPLFFCGLSYPFFSKASVLIPADQAFIAIFDQGTDTVYTSQVKRGTFARENWLRSLGIDPQSQNLIKKIAHQPPFAQKQIRFSFQTPYVIGYTETSDRSRYKTKHTIQTHAFNPSQQYSVIIFPRDIKNEGAHEITLRKNHIHITTTKSVSGKRPWTLY